MNTILAHINAKTHVHPNDEITVVVIGCLIVFFFVYFSMNKKTH